jgi:hypothetical protein
MKILHAINDHVIDPFLTGDEKAILTKYLSSLYTHVSYVIEAGHEIGVNKSQLSVHDLSKLDDEELMPYAMKFYGDDDSKFELAWLHHVHNNPHHWNYWIMPMSNKVFPMTPFYALEMVADWLGASRAYTGTWDMTDWLKDNYTLKKGYSTPIVLHPDTREFVDRVLIERVGVKPEVLE